MVSEGDGLPAVEADARLYKVVDGDRVAVGRVIRFQPEHGPPGAAKVTLVVVEPAPHAPRRFAVEEVFPSDLRGSAGWHRTREAAVHAAVSRAEDDADFTLKVLKQRLGVADPPAAKGGSAGGEEQEASADDRGVGLPAPADAGAAVVSG